MSLPIRLPIKAPSYSAGGANFYIDKTGAIYQTWVGRTVAGGILIDASPVPMVIAYAR